MGRRNNSLLSPFVSPPIRARNFWYTHIIRAKQFFMPARQRRRSGCPLSSNRCFGLIPHCVRRPARRTRRSSQWSNRTAKGRSRDAEFFSWLRNSGHFGRRRFRVDTVACRRTTLTGPLLPFNSRTFWGT